MYATSLHRPLPLVGRTDLATREIGAWNESEVVLKDPVSLSYLQLPAWQARVLESLDGQRSLYEIWQRLQGDPSLPPVALADLQRLLIDLAKKGLIWSCRSGTSIALLEQETKRPHVLWTVLRQPFFIRFPGWSPGSTIRHLSSWMGWVFQPTCVLIAMLFVLTTGVWALLDVAQLRGTSPAWSGMFSGQNLLMLWLIVGALKIVHELSHGVACEHFGAECHSVGAALLLFSPCLYCDVTDAWTLDSKWRRMAISAAGMYAELIIAATSFWLWHYSAPGVLHDLCWQIAVAGSVGTILFNANPLLRYDGYYLLSDGLDLPNLQQRGRESVGHLAARCLFGVRPPRELTHAGTKGNGMILVYGLASAGYQVPLLIGLGWLLYELAKPWGLAPFAGAYVLGVAVAGVVRLGRWTSATAHKQPSRPRLGFHLVVSISLISALLWGLWLCPLPGYSTAPVLIEPHSRVPIYVETPGRLVETVVRSGDPVAAGNRLARLENSELEQRLAALRGQLAVHEIEVRWGRANSNPDAAALAVQALENTRGQLEQLETELSRLELTAPVAGMVLSANHEEWPDFPDLEPTIWSDDAGQQSVGAFLDRRTCLFEIVPSDAWAAILWVDQEQRQFLQPRQTISVRLESAPHVTLRGRVETVGQADEAEVPKMLTESFGGPISTQPSAPPNQPRQPVYRVTVILDETSIPLRAGMQGTGRFQKPQITVGEWLTNEFYRVFPSR